MRVNRVVLATDGAFYLGISEPRALEALIKSHRDRGIYLTAIGVGLDTAQAARGEDADGRRAEFVALARLAASLSAAR